MLTFAMLAAVASVSLAKLESVPFTDVKIQDRFWQPRQEVNRRASVAHCLKELEGAGNYLVFRLAAEGKREGYKGLIFTDSDIYKVLEGVSYTLATHPDPVLDKRTDEIIALIAKAQMKDGYLDTWHQVNRPDGRFTNLRDEHELYCAGHMIEAAVAHHQATGKRNFLEVALKLANLLNQRYGPTGEPGYCGHPELELALYKLWKDTGDDKWFVLSRRMVENRGTHFFAKEHKTPEARYDGTYWLDDVPISEHREIKGHAVRAAYLLSGAADIARETGDQAMIQMLNRVWRNATERRIFITGGIGPSASNEGFTVDYDLPTLTAYQETCASIAMAMWGERMSLLFGDASYMDAVETALYNGLLSGVSLDGTKFFYVNPLASVGNHHRQDWFVCACCPPNVLRTIASLGGYAYARSDRAFYVNLYVGGKVTTKVGGQPLNLSIKTDYPWDGRATYTFDAPTSADLFLRKPGWSTGASVSRNGAAVSSDLTNGYFVVKGPFKKGDTVNVDLPMPVVQMEAHPLALENRGKAAIQRGPLIYCMEQADNATPLNELIIPRGAKTKARFQKDVLGGVVTIEADAQKAVEQDWERMLYQPAVSTTTAKATLVPYGFWDNRKAGPMEVWAPMSPLPSKILGPEGKAKVSVSFQNSNSQPWGINDGAEVKTSGDSANALCHFWPHKGGEEWVQYTWAKPVKVVGSKIFWFDDTDRGECRLPVDFRIQALVGGNWVDVPLKGKKVAMDKWSEVTFPLVTTTAMRLYVKQQPNWASGAHEWKIITD